MKNLAPFVNINTNTDLNGIPMNLEHFSLKQDCKSSTAEVSVCRVKCNLCFEWHHFGFKLKTCRCQQFQGLQPFLRRVTGLGALTRKMRGCLST